ncbi:MAG: L-fuculose-phosphate aldolase [Eubacteriales bacterium]|nr:L-fuculose-phosphate aldolase [Eubacteriales bacterium]
MFMQEEREQVVSYGRKMSQDRLTAGTSGNISILDREKGYMAISPSGIGYFDVRPEDVVIMDLDANIVDGNRKPSSEWALHTAFYKKRADAGAVVHTHSIFCTTLSVLGEPIRPVHYMMADAGVKEIPLAPYVTFGTKELADAAMQAIGGSKAVLLANHGIIVCGENIESAYGLAVNLEFTAEIQWRAEACGTPHVLTDSEMDAALLRFRHYGQPKEKQEK